MDGTNNQVGALLAEAGSLVPLWLTAYELEKERAFIQCIDRFIPSDRVDLLDIGCGLGLHTQLWRERKKKVTASDFSEEFRDYVARTYDFPFIWADVLNCTITERYDICFCMAIGTILHDQGPRFQTFETLARLTRPESSLVLITPTNQRLFRNRSRSTNLHRTDEEDVRKLRELGFELARSFCWSCSPKFLWSFAVLRGLGKLLETVGYRLGIGARNVMIFHRGNGSSAEIYQAVPALEP